MYLDQAYHVKGLVEELEKLQREKKNLEAIKNYLDLIGFGEEIRIYPKYEKENNPPKINADTLYYAIGFDRIDTKILTLQSRIKEYNPKGDDSSELRRSTED